jgi:polyisoprenoid-binding protein YceI
MPSLPSLPVPRRRRLALISLGATLAAAALTAFAVWLVFFSSQAPVAASMDAAVDVAASPSASGTDDSSTGTVDGTWVVDTTVGSFADYSSTYAGFRVNEVLSNIGETTAVGRTPSVSGEIDLAGTTLAAARIEVDLTGITSDQARRDPAIQEALETATYPMATFQLTEPLELGAIPADGETVSVVARGSLTIHGVSREVDVALGARLVGDAIVVVGSADLTFSDFGIRMPTAPIVVSVEDNGTIEFQLFFSRA